MVDVRVIVTSPKPSCTPNPKPYTQPRYRGSQFSLTWRWMEGRGRLKTPRSNAQPVVKNTAAARRRTVPLTSETRKTRPSDADSAPIATPPIKEPSTYHTTVCDHRIFLPLSPRGVMLLSIERPQGDQRARSAAAVARPHPTARSQRLVSSCGKPSLRGAL